MVEKSEKSLLFQTISRWNDLEWQFNVNISLKGHQIKSLVI